VTLPEPVFAYSGPPILDCIEAAMRADPELTIEVAICTVGISWESLARYRALAEAKQTPTTEA
jgi:hypothetical protein